MNKILLCFLLADLTQVLLVELARVVESWLWCLLVDLTEDLLVYLSGVSLPLPLAVSTLLPWIFGLDFYTTSISLRSLSLLSVRGEENELLVAIPCIAIFRIFILVPSRRGCCRSSFSGLWRHSRLWNSGRTPSLSASQYFNIIFQGVLLCAAWFFPIGHHPRPCAWRVRPPLFHFDPFLVFLDLLSLLDLAITQDLLEPTLLLLLPLPLTRRLLLLEWSTAYSSSPPLSPS